MLQCACVKYCRTEKRFETFPDNLVVLPTNGSGMEIFMDRIKVIKMVCILAAITVLAGGLARLSQRNSLSLSEYETLQSTPMSSVTENLQSSSPAPFPPSPSPTTPSTEAPASVLTGALLNGNSQKEQRCTYTEGFYYEPVSEGLQRYMTGVSYPATENKQDEAAVAVTFDDLRYLHILHYDFDGNLAEGELICNAYIVQDLVEIFYQLYLNEYQLESVLLIDEFNGDDTASMEANNTSCFNYRVVEGSSSLSKHAYGLAIDINPLYNPYVTYEKDGTENISPDAASAYADRSINFAYKIDENDLCYKLFTQYGFLWGGNWNHVKDYQHFQKVKP